MVQLDQNQMAILDGRDGPGRAFAMELVVAQARAVGAEGLVPIVGAHVDGCLHHGPVSLDFVRRLKRLAARVSVPTTLNVGSVDLIHPDLVRFEEPRRREAADLMTLHLDLGCTPSFSCAPYQLADSRPAFGGHVAWGESNAIVFANSVLGVRTERYGDFIDLACAIAGFAPAHGLHLEHNRQPRWVLEVTEEASRLDPSLLAVAVGLDIGARHEDHGIAMVCGLPDETSEDDLKALGAAAASAGAVGLFHAEGLTAETRAGATSVDETLPVTRFSVADARAVLATLNTVGSGARLSAVSLGTPHFSMSEFARLMPLIADGGRASVPFTINTNRDALAALVSNGWKERLDAFGATLVTDTCVYVTTILEDLSGAVMTNSGKMAYYAPANLGCEIAFGTLADCVASARAGRVVGSGFQT